MSDNPTLVNSYHNGKTLPRPEERTEMVAFHTATDQVLNLAVELARVVTSSHQAAATQLINGDWSQARKYFSLSDKYAQWADYHTPAVGFGIHAYVTQINKPLRFTQAELEANPEWKDFGVEKSKHPPMRGWLVIPLIGSDNLNYGFLQVSDRYEGEYSQEDETNLLRLAQLTSTALDALALKYLPEYRQKMQV